jgi:hypothetical protein
MGVTDYGINGISGATYSYSAVDVEGFLDITELGIGASNGGVCFDPYAYNGNTCFSLQLNWVDHNVVDGRNLKGSYWAQDVAQIAYDASCSSPCVSGYYSLVWDDNIWNFSNSAIDHNCTTSGEQGCMEGSSFNANLNSECNSAYFDTPYVWLCVANLSGEIVYGLYPPFTIWTYITTGGYNTATGKTTSGANGDCGGTTVSCISFYGSVWEDGTFKSAGYFDGLKFHNTKTSAPSFYVSGTTITPTGYLLYDGEWIAGGASGGAGDTLYLATSTWQEFYSKTGATGTYVSVPHSYSSGSDTAEYAIDVYQWNWYSLRDTATSLYTTDNPDSVLW